MRFNPQDAITVELEDHGQDFLYFDIKNGKIVDTRPWQSFVWNGRTVLNPNIAKGERILFEDDHGRTLTLNYKLIKVTKTRWVR